MDYKEESREMVYKHQSKLNDIVELQKDGSLYLVSEKGEMIHWKEGQQKVHKSTN